MRYHPRYEDVPRLVGVQGAGPSLVCLVYGLAGPALKFRQGKSACPLRESKTVGPSSCTMYRSFQLGPTMVVGLSRDFIALNRRRLERLFIIVWELLIYRLYCTAINNLGWLSNFLFTYYSLRRVVLFLSRVKGGGLPLSSAIYCVITDKDIYCFFYLYFLFTVISTTLTSRACQLLIYPVG